MNAEDLIKQWENARTDRSSWDILWQEIAEYVMPRKATITAKVTPGTKMNTRLYDSTAMLANADLAAWINSNLTSMAMVWSSLKIGEEDNPAREGQLWLERCNKILYSELRASNFYGEIHEAYLDLPWCGTTAIFVEEKEIEIGGFNGLRFETLAPGTYSVLLGKDGLATAMFRDFELSAQAAVDRWGDDVGEKIKKALENNPQRMFAFVHLVFPFKWFGAKHKTKKEFVSYYISIEGKKIVQQGGYEEFPFMVIPWLRASGETYGRGPGDFTLPDNKTLNKQVEMSLKATAKAIDPPLLMLDDGVIGSVRIQAGGVTIISKPNGLAPLKSEARFDVDDAKQAGLRQRINAGFHLDKIKYLPQPEETGKMTAYEVSRRYELMQLLLGPTFGNIITHGLDPLIERSFALMFRGGCFTPPPQSIINLSRKSNGRVNIQYEGPLARAQRTQEIEAINKTMAAVAPIAQMRSDVMDNFDLDEAVRHIADVNGVPAKIIPAKDKVKELRAEKKKALDAEKQQEQIANAADAAGKALPAMKGMGPQGMKAMMQAAGRTGTA